MNRLCISLACCLIMALCASGIARAEVIISEIMYNADHSDRGGDFNKEWVELFNNGLASVDLSGWVFEDIQDSTPASPIPNGTMLGSNESLVLVGDTTTFDEQWGTGVNRIELNNFPTLANSPSASNEILAIKNELGIIQDQVNYDDENGWPTDISDGPSIYVLPDYLTSTGNDIGTHWNSSIPLIDGAYYSQGFNFGEKASPGFVATEPTEFQPFTPSPNAAWSMVVFPDTQNYVKTPAHLPFFVDMAEWVRDNHETWNIELVLQEGDIVNKNSNENPSSGENPSTLQWQNARNTMSILDGEVPYIMAVGNHDTGVNNADNRTTRFNEFFSPSDNPLVDPSQGGILKGVMEPGHLENAYFELHAPDGRDLLILSLAWDPQPAQLGWADQIVSQSKYEDHSAVLLTHSYLGYDGLRNSQGEGVWNDLVKENENFEMVFNGHVGGDGTGDLISMGDGGNLVHQVVFNTQFEGNGGNGWLRVLEFLEDGRTVRIRTFTPSYGYLREDVANEFTFELTPLNPADFDGDGDVDIDDLAVFSSGFGLANADWTNGDADQDGDVDGYDYLQWQRDFGSGQSVAVASSTQVPEPSSFGILVSLLLTIPVVVRRGSFCSI